MARIELDSSLLNHPKTIRLMNITGLTASEAIGKLACLWLWCRDHKKDGNLGGMNDAEISLVAGWQGDPKKFVQGLVNAPDGKIGFLERRDQSLWIHDSKEWLPESEKKKMMRSTNGRHVASKRTPSGGHVADTAESLSLSLPVSQGTTETKTTTKAVSVERPKAVHVEFVDRFKGFYEAVVKKPFKYGRAQFVIADKLIKAHGNEMVVEKAKILAVMCRRKSTWFTKAGWADFSIEKLSSQWNGILEESVLPNEVEEAEEIRRKWRDHNELVTRIMATR